MNVQPELIVLWLKKLRAYAIFKFWEVEGLPPVVTPIGNIVKRPEHEANLVLVVSVDIWSNPSPHHHGNLSPEHRDSRLYLNVAEDELPAPSHISLSVLKKHHLHELLNSLVAKSPHVGSKKNKKVVKTLTTSKIRLGRGKNLGCMKNGNLRMLSWTSNACSGAHPIWH